MSQTFFSKQTPEEKTGRFNQLVSLGENIVIWQKGSKERHSFKPSYFDEKLNELVVDNKDVIFAVGALVLATFEIRGMNFFCEMTISKSSKGYTLLQIPGTLFKSERRSSYRLLTFPIYEVYAHFKLEKTPGTSSVINLNTRSSQRDLFKSFLKLVDAEEEGKEILKIRVQDVSTTGLALHITELEEKFIAKDQVYKNLDIVFPDETICIPEAKIVYVVPYIAEKIKRYKVGVQFINLNSKVDHQIGKKINELLRQIDSNKDFENFIK